MWLYSVTSVFLDYYFCFLRLLLLLACRDSVCVLCLCKSFLAISSLFCLFVSDEQFLFLSRKIRVVRLWILLQRSLEWEHWLRNMVAVLLLFLEMLSFLQITRIRDYTNNPSLLLVSNHHFSFTPQYPYFSKYISWCIIITYSYVSLT